MTTYRKAFDVLKEAIHDPDDPKKLKAAKQHPKLKKTLAGFTPEDMKALKKVTASVKPYPGCGPG